LVDFFLGLEGAQVAPLPLLLFAALGTAAPAVLPPPAAAFFAPLPLEGAAFALMR
jgi:hypothetical protein